jgi:hypothetical protein
LISASAAGSQVISGCSGQPLMVVVQLLGSQQELFEGDLVEEA